ncbi:hypothetical protein PsYK624_150960 [Phanerochaete sordida]|uniref:Uncharacterized protein n=1 Tax=Phanerochaete sordida TaxID=48140 RepID=A0A9P3LLM6_9APHY|nr:hypothetical protein PsYK624_150960 [Phanerochaete sordida]
MYRRSGEKEGVHSRIFLCRDLVDMASTMSLCVRCCLRRWLASRMTYLSRCIVCRPLSISSSHSATLRARARDVLCSCRCTMMPTGPVDGFPGLVRQYDQSGGNSSNIRRQPSLFKGRVLARASDLASATQET